MVSHPLAQFSCIDRTLENDDRKVEEVSDVDVTPTENPIANSELHGDHDSHNTASSENEQVHVPLPHPLSIETIASTLDISYQLADSYRTPAKTTQSSDVPVGPIFVYRVSTSIAVGLLLNLNNVIALAGTSIMGSILSFAITNYFVESLSIVRLLMAA